MLRTVCTRELCTHQFSTFGDKITSAEGINSQAEIGDLLVFMLMKAAESHRKELVLDPYPCVYGGASGKDKLLHPDRKDYPRLLEVVGELSKLRSESGPSVGASWTTLASRMSEVGA